jgi:hypothetical protein
VPVSLSPGTTAVRLDRWQGETSGGNQRLHGAYHRTTACDPLATPLGSAFTSSSHERCVLFMPPHVRVSARPAVLAVAARGGAPLRRASAPRGPQSIARPAWTRDSSWRVTRATEVHAYRSPSQFASTNGCEPNQQHLVDGKYPRKGARQRPSLNGADDAKALFSPRSSYVRCSTLRLLVFRIRAPRHTRVEWHVPPLSGFRCTGRIHCFNRSFQC